MGTKTESKVWDAALYDRSFQFISGMAADLVDDLTDVSEPRDGNRKVRKAMDREHSARTSARAQTIKLADLISNSSDITANDPSFAKVYLAEKALLLEVLIKGDPALLKKAASYLGDQGQ